MPLASEEGLAADPAPSPPEPEEDAGRQSPDPDRREEPEPETMREALDDADDDFAALEQVADTEPSTMDIPPLPEPAETEPPMDDGTDTDPFADVRVRRAIPWKAIGITVAALLAVGLMCFASMFVRQVRQCFSVVWADGFPRCRHRFPVM